MFKNKFGNLIAPIEELLDSSIISDSVLPNHQRQKKSIPRNEPVDTVQFWLRFRVHNLEINQIYSLNALDHLPAVCFCCAVCDLIEGQEKAGPRYFVMGDGKGLKLLPYSAGHPN